MSFWGRAWNLIKKAESIPVFGFAVSAVTFVAESGYHAVQNWRSTKQQNAATTSSLTTMCGDLCEFSKKERAELAQATEGMNPKEAEAHLRQTLVKQGVMVDVESLSAATAALTGMDKAAEETLREELSAMKPSEAKEHLQNTLQKHGVDISTEQLEAMGQAVATMSKADVSKLRRETRSMKPADVTERMLQEMEERGISIKGSNDDKRRAHAQMSEEEFAEIVEETSSQVKDQYDRKKNPNPMISLADVVLTDTFLDNKPHSTRTSAEQTANELAQANAKTHTVKDHKRTTALLCFVPEADHPTMIREAQEAQEQKTQTGQETTTEKQHTPRLSAPSPRQESSRGRRHGADPAADVRPGASGDARTISQKTSKAATAPAPAAAGRWEDVEAGRAGG